MKKTSVNTRNYCFCTYFDTHYLVKGLALYNSLFSFLKDKLVLYVLAFDDFVFDYLSAMNYSGIKIIQLSDFEDKELLTVKKNRSIVEYYWTCTPALIEYVLNICDESIAVYVDADLFFYSSPDDVILPYSGDHIGITPHRYSLGYDQTKNSGKYCVQFMPFRKSIHGFQVVKWWKKKCIEWCYNRFEDGKFGDQKYLDDWPTRFLHIHDIQNIGVGLAPWNIQRYEISKKENFLLVHEKNHSERVVFFHFHNLTFRTANKIDIGNYRIDKKTRNIFYWDYINRLIAIEKELAKNYPEVDFRFAKSQKITVINLLKLIKRVIRGEYNIYTLESIMTRELSSFH